MTVSLNNVAIREVSVTLPSQEAYTPHIRLTNVSVPITNFGQPRKPNAETVEVLLQTERGEDIVRFKSLDDLITDCEAYAESPDD